MSTPMHGADHLMDLADLASETSTESAHDALVEQARELWSPDVSRADFKTTVDRLCARIVGLPPPPPDPRQPSPPPRPKSM